MPTNRTKKKTFAGAISMEKAQPILALLKLDKRSEAFLVADLLEKWYETNKHRLPDNWMELLEED